MTNPTDPRKRYRVDEIQKEHPPYEQPPREEIPTPPPHLPRLLLAILVLFKKFMDALLGHSPETLRSACQGHLLSMKEALIVLQQENKSHDIAFLNSLSTYWLRLLEDTLQFRENSPWSEKIRSFTTEWQRYPRGEEHSLGYYLSACAGQKWLPFPYMEMISELHKEHREHPEESLLSKWVKELEILSRMI